jgi:CBS domain-containing protein
MELSDHVASVLRGKDNALWTVTPSASVYDALALMANKNVGALPVISGTVLVGILSERDYARKIILMGRASKETRVEEIMQTPPVTVAPSDTIGKCMELITASRVRHLLVIDGAQMLGIVSIGDLVNWIITRQQETIQHLHEYIAGSYPR